MRQGHNPSPGLQRNVSDAMSPVDAGMVWSDSDIPDRSAKAMPSGRAPGTHDSRHRRRLPLRLRAAPVAYEEYAHHTQTLSTARLTNIAFQRPLDWRMLNIRTSAAAPRHEQQIKGLGGEVVVAERTHSPGSRKALEGDLTARHPVPSSGGARDEDERSDRRRNMVPFTS
jgi:hypothetical protein